VALKIAVIGLADSSRGEAPWGDPQWEKWGLAWDSRWPELSRTFEMHDQRELKRGYVEELQYRTRLYTQEKYPQIDGCTRYPIEDVTRSTGDYFVSSVAYMLALAIHEGADEIGLWGVDMDRGTEYEYQRANGEYLIGFARGRGIKIHLPASSPLCKFSPVLGYAHRYGSLNGSHH
jgi:hypothetical protein